MQFNVKFRWWLIRGFYNVDTSRGEDLRRLIEFYGFQEEPEKADGARECETL